ncbi:TetR/AcrR family transcriptional regulator [Hoeflea prorocentri]|uniref:TetR/AcrR family transcriptional regulator n=1 Tax=Hoeflea prorocentri TaxID=1922333 RepID=A0A9X3ULH3_9HYPH|nr:TetR/AcrR family transcriptional regulator [Hoeflea prorocentri]MCY6383432.1 TetR/AcrR family transcriptional regulator [Hoeflea prorocentri]MDA5401232.1 TetR/AcrR family transcriptional regulator [Hoeflea prorocentri]
MRQENRARRQQQIEEAAYAVLKEKGYAGTSMLAIAKRARASNETLYNWYGDKRGLFCALVARNADEVRGDLEASLKQGRSALQTLAELGPKLLSMLTGTRAVALNQAAAADPTGELGAAISETGRETIAPLIRQVLEQARDTGNLSFEDPQDATELYLGLLIGDLQIRRAIGRQPELDPDYIARRSELALEYLNTLLSPDGTFATP